MDAVTQRPPRKTRMAKQGAAYGVSKAAVTLWLSEDLLTELKARATDEDRTITSQVTHYIRRGLAQDKAAITSTK